MDEIDELKPCPFCGKIPIATISNGVVCETPECPVNYIWVKIGAWQTRPIEDSLQARAEKAEAERDQAREMVERPLHILHIDEGRSLTESLTVEEHKAWQNMVQALKDENKMLQETQDKWEHRNDKPEEPK